MLKIYCSCCGGATSYSIQKPKFCSACGQSFSLFDNSEKKKEAISNIIQEELENLDREDVYRVPNLNKLNFDIDIENYKKEKISDLINQKDQEGEELIEVNKKPKDFAKRNTLEDFAKEAGALRPKSVTRSVKNGKKNKI